MSKNSRISNLFRASHRGAIAYAVSLHLDVEDQDQRRALITTALCVVLFTILVLGGSTYPLVKWMNVSR